MLTAIEFDDQVFFKADKVHDIVGDGLLAAEFGIDQPARPEFPPQQAFGISGISSEVAGGLRLHPPVMVRLESVSPSPQPSPARGEGWGEGAYTPSSTSTPHAFSAIASVM